MCYKGYAPSVKEEMSQLIICLLSVVLVKLFGFLLCKPLNPTFDWGESALDEKFKLWYKTIFFLQNSPYFYFMAYLEGSEQGLI